MGFGSTLQKRKEKPAEAATTTVVEEAVVEGVPEGYAEKRKEAKELFEAMEGAEDSNASEASRRTARAKKQRSLGRSGTVIQPSTPPEGQGPTILERAVLGEIKPPDSVLALPEYPEQRVAPLRPSGEAQKDMSEVAAETYLRRLERPAGEVRLRSSPGVMGAEYQQSSNETKPDQFIGMSFNDLNEQYEHMSIPLLNEYIKQAEMTQTDLRKSVQALGGGKTFADIMAASGRPTMSILESLAGGAADGYVSAKTLGDPSKSLEQALKKVSGDVATAQATLSQMKRIRDALQAEAKSDKK